MEHNVSKEPFVELIIRRQDGPQTKAYLQRILYQTADRHQTIAAVLTELGENPDIRDDQGNPIRPVRWECSCLQKKCGACAMRINRTPRLACDARLEEFSGKILLEPLLKFPVVADLIVDRSILFENLKEMQVWLEGEAKVSEKQEDMAYEGSRCLQCGCCLEICPNFYVGGKFAGMAAMTPTARLLSELPDSQRQEMVQAYRRWVYEGCGKSLACRKVCPAGIDLDGLMVRANAGILRRCK